MCIVKGGKMTRTNIVLDETLIGKAKRVIDRRPK